MSERGWLDYVKTFFNGQVKTVWGEFYLSAYMYMEKHKRNYIITKDLQTEAKVYRASQICKSD